MTRKRIYKLRCLVLGALAIALGLFAASAIAAGREMSIVYAVGRSTIPPAVTKDDVRFICTRSARRWRIGPEAEKLYLAVLIDDSLDSMRRGQWVT